MVENYNATLKILTPIIINSGDSFDFAEIYSKESSEFICNKFLECYKGYQFYTSKLFEGFSADKKRKLVDRITNASIKRDNSELSKIRREIVSCSEKDKIRIPCRFLPQAYENLTKKPLQKVDKVMQDELSGFTYIPGSSIKGAIRTAVLEGLRSKYGLTASDKGNSKAFEKEIINNRNKEKNVDPFQYLKVSDFAFSGKDGMQFIGRIGDDDKIPIYSSMTNAYVFKGGPVIAKGSISIDTEFYEALGVNFSVMKKYIGDFFLSPFEKNKDFRRKLGGKAMQSVVEYLDDDESSDVYFRLGHYIGIQNYTLNIIRTLSKTVHNPSINIEGGNRAVCIESGIIPGICMLGMDKAK